MKYKLICVDIDGTLLDDNKQIPPRAKESLKRARDMGIEIALISGRMPAGLDSVEKELGFSCIKACNAGTYILRNHKCIAAEYFPAAVMLDIYQQFAEKYHIPLWIFREEKWVVTGMDHRVQDEIDIIRYIPEVVDARLLAEQWERNGIGPNKVLISADPAEIQQIYKELKARNFDAIDMACSAANFLEIYPRGMTKGRSLELICKELGITPEETIAFGDQELDIPMIEAAGIGIAMGNAISELKEKAVFVTKTNNDAGIADALEHYL